jgi:hypothetical protein
MAAGCGAKAPRQQVPVDQDVLGPLDAQRLRQVYETPAFAVRAAKDGRPKVVQDTELAPGTIVDDSNLLIFAEGSGDSVEAFRWTARLLAESPHGFSGAPQGLVVVLVHWGASRDVVTEHMHRDAQLAGAATLLRMLEVHRFRHGERGHASVIGFSAGTRVTEFAFMGKVETGAPTYPEALAHVNNVVFLGSSISREDPLPFGPVRGRFINFVNPRDTHYGDRAPYIAPAGEGPRPLEFLAEHTLVHRPLFGASASGFLQLPTLTSDAQFDAIDLPGPPAAREALDRAFKMINVPVPTKLMPRDLLGLPVLNDDLDDYLNQAPNHYIMVGRGPAGRMDGLDFTQYCGMAEEFVRQHVGAAAFRGRVYGLELGSVPGSENPLRWLLPFPSATLEKGQRKE